MEQNQKNDALLALLRNNPEINVAWIDDTTSPPTLRARVSAPLAADGLAILLDGNPRPLDIPITLAHYTFSVQHAQPLKTLLINPSNHAAKNANQLCQNEPIKLGTQIQPQGADWLGTGGAPVRWQTPTGQNRWGVLSNYHVMCPQGARIGLPIHQPTNQQPPFAYLEQWSHVTPNATNQVDAAVANTRLGPFHTISNEILYIGAISDRPLTAAPGLAVIKSGRTTGLTHATCVGTGATARVGYGTFDATFIDQDVYEGKRETFSAPGDSGSAIIAEACRCLTSLLFAGSDTMTIGNPIRHVADALNLKFPFIP